MQVTTNTRGRRAPALAARLGRHARRLLRGLRLGGAELSVVLVSDREMRALNRRWRRRDRPSRSARARVVRPTGSSATS